MKFIGSRELRLNPTQVWKDLEDEGEIIVTTNGKPMAILTRADETNWEEALRAIRRARTQMAVSQMRRRSRKDITSTVIDKEIAAARKKSRGGA